MSNETWKVRQHVNNRDNTVFEGTEHDARRYVSENFPRVHVEPGTNADVEADAVLVSPSGGKEVYYGPEYENDNYDAGFGPVDLNKDPRDRKQTAKKETPAKTTAAKKTTAPSFPGNTNAQGRTAQ